MDLAAYLRAPVGHAVASRHVLCWRPTPTLRVIALWGKPDADDVALLTSAMARELDVRPARYASVVDLRGLKDVPAEAFATFVAFMEAHRDAFAARVRHSAIVHAGGATAALAAGYTRLVRDPFPSSLHDRLEPAFARVGHRTDGPRLRRRLAALLAQARDRDAKIGRVAAYLEAHLAGATLAGCARALGVAARTLQRQLGDRGTTFREVLATARVARAAELLRETDAKLYAIARDVGYGKAQSLATAFARRRGTTPGAWRARQHR